jgi:hypothetical protein
VERLGESKEVEITNNAGDKSIGYLIAAQRLFSTAPVLLSKKRVPSANGRPA